MSLRLFLCLAVMLTAAPAAVTASEVSAKGAASASRYMAFPGVTASILRPDRRRGVLALDASLDIPDEALRTRARAYQPRLRAAYAQALNMYAAGVPPGRPVDPAYISRELQRQTDMVIGKSGATFLIGSILIN
jgi:hypothetical protein